ncbi:hypothetical protein Nepgr_019754 [Nepenthes gracilis]|uniref:Uncharacterized protein n=1 Tax=Nepenthes gracilis TaxID=150966 RepID=A0AAD3SU02_NEPGR|nr:hypothetical protein Nepgr_019754 [Nepenthes gracilis]
MTGMRKSVGEPAIPLVSTAPSVQQEVLSLSQNWVDTKALEEMKDKMEAAITEAQQYKDKVFNLETEL